MLSVVDSISCLSTVSRLREEVFEANGTLLDSEHNTYPTANIDALRKAGLLAVGIPRERGGLGNSLDLGANDLYREIAKASSSTAQVFFVHVACVDALMSWPNPSIQDLVAREVLGAGAAVAVAAAELGKTIAARDVASERVAGGYRLNGLKAFCTGHEGARYMVTSVVLKGVNPREAGMTCFVPLDCDGVQVNRDWDNMGQRSTSSGTVLLNNVFIPDDLVVGPPGSGFSVFNSPFLQSGFASIFLGIAEGALAQAVVYLREKARPRPGIAEHAIDDPLVQWHIGDMATQVQATSLMLAHVNELLRRHQRSDASRAEVLTEVAKLKVQATRTVLDVTARIFQVMGARSTSSKYNFDRYWRDARTLTLHDPVDTRLQEVGREALTGIPPREMGDFRPLTTPVRPQ